MKISYFRLKGYIKVLNGMGLDEIEIPFNTFKNRIILVQGENGCAKSTIIEALSPSVDSSDSFRTDVFFDENGNQQIIEYPAEKEIRYLDADANGFVNEYRILIQSIVDGTKTRRTTKAFISKNGEELNPNGNVSTFKEIRDELLGIDPIYLDLSSISSENRGIVDMTPSDRKRYMASYIGSLDTYNNIFKIISKKATNIKSYINTLNSKIYSIGDENELRLQLAKLELSLKDMNATRDNLISELAKAEATVNVIDPDNKIQDKYNSIAERLEAINSDIDKNQRVSSRIISKLGIITSDIDKLNTELANINSLIEEHKTSNINNKAKITALIEINKESLNRLESNRMTLAGLTTNTIQNNIESAVNDMQAEVDTYKDYLKDDIELLNTISIDELVDLKESLNNFKTSISVIEELYNDTEYGLAVTGALDDSYEKEVESIIISCKEKISDNDIKVVNMRNDISNIDTKLKELEEFENARPKECKIDTCPYIAKYIVMGDQSSMRSKISDIEHSISDIISEHDTLVNTISTSEHVIEMIRKLNIVLSTINAKKSIISKVSSISFMLNIDELKTRLINHNRFSEFDYVSELLEKAYIYSTMLDTEKELDSLKNELKSYLDNKSLIDSLTSMIDKDEKDYSKRESEILSLTKECGFLDELVSSLTEKSDLYKELIESETSLSKLNSDKDNLRTEFREIRDNIKIIKEKMDSVNIIKNDIENIENNISPISESISQLKYDIGNIVQFQNELAENIDIFDKIEFIKDACSPGRGNSIQSEYIKRYMNDIIIDCNQMLGYMFGGNIQLDIPNIDEKHFSIPFLGPSGIMVPDISNGSTAQKCMIGLVFSCVAMMKSSTKYNIPRFDEIDGGLDQQNRITFINVLNQILNFMRSEQCIICSHNMEFDAHSTTRLVCSHTGIRIEQ